MDYIYHYTTLPSLVSIISKKQLRLTRLDKFLNLYEEGFPTISEDPWGLSKKMKNIYISSWTNDSSESLSKWKLFSNLEDGVRIGINTQKIFGDLGTCEISTVVPLPYIYNSTFFQEKKPANKMCISSEINIIEQQKVFQIVYEDFNELLNADCKSLSKQYELINSLLTSSINSIASQREVRLQIKTEVPRCPNKKREIEEYERGLRKDDLIDYILVSLPDIFFEDIEILVSPNFSEENLKLLQSFMSGQGHVVQVQESALARLYKDYLVQQTYYIVKKLQ